MNKTQIKLQRVAEVNAVIKAISNHGRRFFFNAQHNRVAEIKIGNNGAILLIDDYTGMPVYTAYKYDWRWFSHGGTLRRLVEGFAEYIRSGKQIHPGNIGLVREWTDGDVWGYGKDAIQAVWNEIENSPVFYQTDEQKAA